MKKDDILARSREENKNKDVYEQEVIKQGQSVAAIAASILATLFLIIQILEGGGMNCGLYAVLCCHAMVTSWMKWVKLKKKDELIMALLYTVLVLILSIEHIYNLITAKSV